MNSRALTGTCAIWRGGRMVSDIGLSCCNAMTGG
jgi:hypothetical protein